MRLREIYAKLRKNYANFYAFISTNTHKNNYIQNKKYVLPHVIPLKQTSFANMIKNAESS